MACVSDYYKHNFNYIWDLFFITRWPAQEYATQKKVGSKRPKPVATPKKGYARHGAYGFAHTTNCKRVTNGKDVPSAAIANKSA